MDAYLAIVSKREVREYDGRPLDPATERRILEAGRIAGSSRNRQARRFVVLRDPGLREIAASCVFAPTNVLGAALVVAVVVGAKGPTDFDAGRAAQNMMLAASTEGVGSCPNGIADPARLAEAVGAVTGEAAERVSIVITFGYPVRPGDPSRRSAAEWLERADRRPFDEVVAER